MGTDVAKTSQQLLAMGPEGQKAFNQLASSVANAEIPVKKLDNMFTRFGDTLIRTIRWQLASSLIHGFIGTMQ